ncbi:MULTISPECIES: glycosyltransferase [unclassified Nostoc]|uniref:glycosyltransferase n=1 Tax=unclassified Nostoc TaxID=2593658 RepID=UPI002AD2013B|nr:glycosyltransferase [Nostoc sp. DedQUE03]MDZ7973507.1 glycosyltransferase [Nostoc sp. DedQUE03]MDZ8047254.1 glycosyltransferase [Nostoc sp. DedQUE02]
MKVLHVIASVTKVRGGTSQAVLDMVRALQTNNVYAEIATTNDDGDNLLDVPLQKCIEYEHVPVWFFHRFSPNVKMVREYAFSAQFTQWLWENISKYELVHVHALFSYPSTIAMAIARLKKVPYIVTPHGLLCEWSLQQSKRRKQTYFQLIEQANLNSSQTIHFTSQKEQQEVSLLELQTSNFVLPLGLSLPTQISDAPKRLRQKFNIPLNEPVILFLSRLHYKKGLEYLIPALSKLTHYHFTFILAGNGTPDYEAQIESLLVSNGLRDRTLVVGFVEGETKDILMQGSDLFVLTSYSENFAVSVLEALAVGVPVLVTPGVALAAVVKENQIGYVPEMNVTAITDALENYFINPQQAKKMGDRARKLICENYTWDRIASKLISVYTDMIENQSVPGISQHK